MRLLVRGFHHMLLLANVGATLASVLTYAASYISPEEFWYLFFLTYAALPLLFIHLGFVLWWSLKRRRYVWISVAVLLLGYGINNRLFQFSWAEKADDSFLIMSYNTGNFMENGRRATDIQRTKTAIGQLVKEIKPDLICFQEYASQARGRHDITDLLLDTLGFKAGYFEKIRDLRHEGYAGMAIFSRYPIVNKRFIPFKSTRTTNALIYADIVLGTDTLRVFNVHLQSNRLGTEEFQTMSELTENTEESRKGILKLLIKLRDAAQERTVQTLLVEEQIRRSPYPVILCGDLNDLPSSYAYGKVRGELQDSFIAKGRGFGNTYAGIFPSFRIDHIFAAEQFDILSHQVRREKHSDHYPVLSRLRIQSSSTD